MTTGANAESPVVEWLPQLRCVRCGGGLEAEANSIRCRDCSHRYHVIDGTVRMTDGLDALDAQEMRSRTASSFAFEWDRFGDIREEWERNFADYMQPHRPAFFHDLSVLDAGTGSGRHARQAALYGAKVAAIDLGRSIDVARRNVPTDVLTVQADLERLPFEPGSFDFVMSIGVLHHLPDPRRALNYLARFAKPGGRVRIYLYWQPARRWHRTLLKGVERARVVTTRLPHRVLEALCYPLALMLWLGFVGPYKALRHSTTMGRLAAALPLQTYADYPLGVLVNDTFDRLSAPIENRYTKSEVVSMMSEAGLTEVSVLPNGGWVAEGRVPSR